MFRWDQIEPVTFNGSPLKFYRPMYKAAETTTVVGENLELDGYASKYLESEILMYRILDTNFIDYMEARGDMNRLVKLKIPTRDA